MAAFDGFLFEVRWGTTDFLDFQIKLNGVPQNITGWTIWFTAKRRVTDPDPGVFQKSTTNGGIIVTDALNGIGYVRLDFADTNSLPQERTLLFADQKARDGLGQLFITEQGIVQVDPVATLAVV